MHRHVDPKPAPAAEPLERADADASLGGALRQELLSNAGQPDCGRVEVARSPVRLGAGISSDRGRGGLAECMDEGCAVELRRLLALLRCVNVQRFTAGEEIGQVHQLSGFGILEPFRLQGRGALLGLLLLAFVEQLLDAVGHGKISH